MMQYLASAIHCHLWMHIMVEEYRSHLPVTNMHNNNHFSVSSATILITKYYGYPGEEQCYGSFVSLLFDSCVCVFSWLTLCFCMQVNSAQRCPNVPKCNMLTCFPTFSQKSLFSRLNLCERNHYGDIAKDFQQLLMYILASRLSKVLIRPFN